nr:reverse transcriptase domain-containing protein [Tanacetum cinerariifolium]
MRTRSRSRNNFPQQEASPVIVELLRIELPFLEDQFSEDPPPEVPMADNRTMAELLQAPTEGYEDAIVILEIFFPPSKTTNLHNEITRFQQRFDESFYEAGDRFKDLLRAFPHHGFSELHQLDTFYNALNVNDQDSLNSAAGRNFLDKMPRECLKIIESKSKVRQSRAKPVIAQVSTSSSTPAISSEVAELKDMVRALLLDKKNQSSTPTQSSTPALVKAVEPNCVTCGETVKSSSRLASDQSSNPTSSMNPNPKGRNRRRSKQRIENSNLEEQSHLIVTRTDNRTMAELLRAPTEGTAHRWLEKEPPHSITTWEDLVSNFINEFFPLKNNKPLYKDLLCAYPHHGFTELHKLETFYNALNPVDQDSLNAAAGGNLLERSTQDVLTNKSKVRNSRSKPIASQVKACDVNSNSSEIAKLTHAVNQQTNVVTTAVTAILNKFQANPPPAPVKAVEETCVTCRGAHPYYQCLAAGGNTFPEFKDNI